MYSNISTRFRPTRFSDVVGQDGVVCTLINSISGDNIAKAYLFAGMHGIGKTTLVRVFAKSLNCLNRENGEPCNLCTSCKEIMSGSSLDVIEIDGASNRGIDDIRSINETLGYVTFSSKYKIFIIDEVHMLTKEAFNALLKSLEEPPKHVLFFLATTEPSKVLPTILSRCQRFDLARMSEKDIISRLSYLSQKCKFNVSKTTLSTLAKSTGGSMRDAEGLLEKLASFSNGEITEDVISRVLGLFNEEWFLRVDRAYSIGDISFPYKFTKEIYDKGGNFSVFLENLFAHYRDALLGILGKKALSAEFIQRVKSVYSVESLSMILDYFVKFYMRLMGVPIKRIHLEMILTYVMQSKNRVPPSEIVKSVEDLIKHSQASEVALQVPTRDRSSVGCSNQAPEVEDPKPPERDRSSVETLLNFTKVLFDGVLS